MRAKPFRERLREAYPHLTDDELDALRAELDRLALERRTDPRHVDEEMVTEATAVIPLD